MSNQSWLRGRTVVYNPTPVYQAQPKPAFSVLRFPKMIVRFLWRIIRSFAIVIGLIVLIAIGITVWVSRDNPALNTPTIPNKTVLTFNLDGELPARSGTTELLSLLQQDRAPLTLDDVVDAIDRAAKDKRIEKLAVKASGGGYNLTQLQSLREAVARFKVAGKETYIYSESYGEGGYGLGLYYFASIFDSIWVQPVGNVAVGGLNMQIPYFKKIMDKYGVEAQFFQRKEYKSAMEHLTSDKMSDANREAMQSLLKDMAGQIISPIKADRKKVADNFDSTMNAGYLTDKAALQAGLVDVIGYEDSLFKSIREKAEGIELLSLSSYIADYNHKKLEASLLPSGQKVSVAIIPINGMIVSGSAHNSPYGMGDNLVGADDIVQAIKDAAYDPSIRTIVLQINSPGGSPSASETIHRVITWAKTEKKKPVIAVMGAVAASGGYWVATAADKIYAMDGTLTGSIGVVGGKVNFKGLWDNLGVNWETLAYGQNSGMLSFNTPFSKTEQVQFEKSLDNIYAYFIQRVVDGRKMPADVADKIAKGRAYTGRQAKELGLVDVIGGMDVALDQIAKDNGASARQDLNLVYLPMNNDPMELLMMMLSSEVALSPWIDGLTARIFGALPFLQSGLSSAVYSDVQQVRF